MFTFIFDWLNPSRKLSSLIYYYLFAKMSPPHRIPEIRAPSVASNGGSVMSVSNRRLDKVTEDTSGEREGEGEKEPLDLEMTRRRMRAYNTLTVAESEVDLRKAAAESEEPVHQVRSLFQF